MPSLRRTLLGIVAIAAAATSARAELRSHLDGDVRPVGPVLEDELFRSYLNSPGAPAATFVLDAVEPSLDFRAAPGTLVVTGPNGSLTAEAGDPPTLYGVLPRDPESGRPLKVGSAEGATCPTGAEPDCWVDGNPIPFDADVYAALWSLREPPTVIPVDPYTTNPETQALLGCGPYWGTDCAVTGIDLTRAQASVLLQSWPGIGPPPPVRVIDPITGRPLPTPGVRGPGIPVYLPPSPGNVSIDGVVDPAPAPVRVPGLRSPVSSGGSSLFGRRDFVFDNEMAALSWNFLMVLASMSGDGAPPWEIQEFDPSQPMTIARCSFATPQYCESVRVLYWFAAELLDDDPLAPPTLRFVWEAGARYEVIEATGDFAPYAGGVAHVLGLERSRTTAATHGIPLLLFPAGETLDPSAPFATAPPGMSESPTFGLAYLTAPEASGAGFVATALLAALARRRRPSS